MGVATGCGCKEVYISSYYLSLLLLYLFFFAAASLIFVNFLKCFSFLFQYFFVIHFIYNSICGSIGSCILIVIENDS